MHAGGTLGLVGVEIWVSVLNPNAPPSDKQGTSKRQSLRNCTLGLTLMVAS